MIDLALIDYATCHKYAETLGVEHGIAKCDWADIGSDAYLDAIRRAWRTAVDPDKNEESLARTVMYTSVINVINRRNTLANRIFSESEDISATSEIDSEPTDDEPIDGGIIISDDGVGAKRIVSFDEDWQHPFWLRLFNLERQKLRNERQKSPLADAALKVVKAGLKDSRLSLIKDSLKISGSRFQTILNFFKARFALCFQALREYRGQNECPTF